MVLAALRTTGDESYPETVHAEVVDEDVGILCPSIGGITSSLVRLVRSGKVVESTVAVGGESRRCFSLADAVPHVHARLLRYPSFPGMPAHIGA